MALSIDGTYVTSRHQQVTPFRRRAGEPVCWPAPRIGQARPQLGNGYASCKSRY
jgi:hypothetical protein